MMTVRVPQEAWYNPKEMSLRLPDDWQVETCNMAGYNRPALAPAAIRKALRNPIGCPSLHEMAKGKKEVVIIFDDMSRVTRVKEIVPHVLSELAEAGIPDRHIRFVMALGTHGARDRRDFAKKLGEDVMKRFPVYNHNAFGNCVYVGTTKTFKTRVSVNEEVMKCDLKIAIGSVVPHPMTGYGGGGKMILPGVSSFETIHHNHKAFWDTVVPQGTEVYAMGSQHEKNAMIADVAEAAQLAGLDMIINSVVNLWGDTVALYAGALKPAYAAAVEESEKHYLTPTVTGKDIVIANTYAKANEGFIGLAIAYPAIKPSGGDVVLMANLPEGQVIHYLIGAFGNKVGGPLHQFPQMPPQVNRLIVFSRYGDVQSSGWYEGSSKVVFAYTWRDVLRLLKEAHGKGTQVAVYPNAEIQYCKQ